MEPQHRQVATPAGSIGIGDLTICGGKGGTVRRVVVHPPDSHPRSIIANHMTAVEVVTDLGSRWIGVRDAHIGADLRVYWTGGPGH